MPESDQPRHCQHEELGLSIVLDEEAVDGDLEVND